jgi:hypothetical protein
LHTSKKSPETFQFGIFVVVDIRKRECSQLYLRLLPALKIAISG